MLSFNYSTQIRHKNDLPLIKLFFQMNKSIIMEALLKEMQSLFHYFVLYLILQKLYYYTIPTAVNINMRVIFFVNKFPQS